MTNENHRCWAEIDRSALRRNVAFLREKFGPGVEFLAVVKANAYGHGMIDVARTIADQTNIFGVANLEEATALRGAVQHPIAILGPALPEERAAIADRAFIPSVSTVEEAEDFDRVARGRKVPIIFKVDTGMGRMGVLEKEAVAVFKHVHTLPSVSVHSVSTHLTVSDQDEQFTLGQLDSFATLIRKLRAEVPGDYKAHALQTAGVLAFADEPFEIVRPGMFIYGVSSLPEFQNVLHPVMTWKARIALIRDMPAGHGISYGRTFITPKKMRVATLSCGYADGYPRHLSNRGASVLVRGQRCPLLGRVTMDLMMIDVSNLPVAAVGDEVVLMGRQGNEEVSCTELADRAHTITWEIMTRIGPRVRRIYV
ncbi:MAG TPA: alanine racemase [Chthoniobacterales bacterium]|nr:alanine racemase [Chthoniobacterales bacterium]